MRTIRKVHAPLGSFPRALGEVCLKKRNELKLSQIDLAKKAGVNKDCPSTAEYGGVRMKLDTFMRLSKGLEVEPDILIREALNLQQEHIRSLQRAAELRALANGETQLFEVANATE